jgi:hypothetical protein
MMTPEERAEFIADVAAAIKAVEPAPVLTDEEQQWVRLAIQKEAQSIKLRQAVIEKTLAGLVWSAVIGLGYVFLDFFKNHGFK